MVGQLHSGSRFDISQLVNLRHLFKRSCAALRLSTGSSIVVRCVSGHARQLGIEWAHELASEACRNLRPQFEGSLTEEFLPDTDDERRRRKQQRRRDLLATVPINPDFWPPGLHRAAQVFINWARSGYALTDDVVARWRQVSNRLGQHCASTAVDDHGVQSTPAPYLSQPTCCYACKRTLLPTIQHLVWNCAGLAEPRLAHRPAWVLSYED